MYPELFHLGGLTIYSYGFFILLGVIAAYWYFFKSTKKYGLNSEQVSELFLWCIASVFIGGKVFFFFEKPAYYIQHFDSFMNSLGSGFVFYGSFLATVPTLIWWFRKKQLPVWEMFDHVGIAGALVHGFGKLGCFMAGCCHGIACKTGWGVVFSDPNTKAEPANVPLYPVQLWDAAIIFTAVAVMLFVQKRKQFTGQVFLLYGIIYAIGRFLTENYRGDEARGFVLNGLLSHSQAIALVVLLVCVYFYIQGSKSRKLN